MGRHRVELIDFIFLIWPVVLLLGSVDVDPAESDPLPDIGLSEVLYDRSHLWFFSDDAILIAIIIFLLLIRLLMTHFARQVMGQSAPRP